MPSVNKNQAALFPGTPAIYRQGVSQVFQLNAFAFWALGFLKLCHFQGVPGWFRSSGSVLRLSFTFSFCLYDPRARIWPLFRLARKVIQKPFTALTDVRTVRSLLFSNWSAATTAHGDPHSFKEPKSPGWDAQGKSPQQRKTKRNCVGGVPPTGPCGAEQSLPGVAAPEDGRPPNTTIHLRDLARAK